MQWKWLKDNPMKNVLIWIAAGALGVGLLVFVGALDGQIIGFPNHGEEEGPPTCADWDMWFFHRRTTVEQVRRCVESGQAHVNQVDEEGRTLMHRIARDIRSDDYKWRAEDGEATYDTFLDIARELLTWDDFDIDHRDHYDRTALDETLVRQRGWPLAGILLNGGATITVADDAMERFEKYGTPMLEAGRDRLVRPLSGNIDPDRLLACKTADCLVEEVLR